ncbi:potassium channel family protein [Mesobacillus maritimus]|uniref:potassium channel family protein n=1 Tax=Mesobacillus maritimus TaxID=1643336 RepID=UPI00203FBF0B|nr:potassium channel family protein [Mesobacillus maritimus]MCM3670334.1 potassium channel family protein [Mesobacillus maritimus]
MGILHRMLSKLIHINLWHASVIAIGLIILSSFLMKKIEPDTFPRYSDALWWTMTTLVTVGYGDLYPKTIFGQIFTMTLIYTFGIGAMGILVGKLFQFFAQYKKKKEEGKLNFDGKNHYVLIGISKDKLESILEEILHSNKKSKVVVVDHSPHSPVEHDNVHFISGNPADEETLLKANIFEAHSVAIFSEDQNQFAAIADGKTLLIATRVESLSKKYEKSIYTVVEIQKESHISLFEHANVDEVILSNASVSRLMAQASIHHGSSKLFKQLLSKADGENLYQIKKKPHWKNYKEAALELFEQGATLISDGGSLDLPRRSMEDIPENARMFIICDEQTYNEINNV